MTEQINLVPKRRFTGFTQAWAQYKLGEVVRITMGQSPNGENYTDNPEDFILVQGNADMKNGQVTPRVWTTQVTKTADVGDLIMSVRAPVGEVGKTAYSVVIGRGVASIKGNEFIYQSLLRMNNNGYWKQFSSGSTFDSINSNDLASATVSITNDIEQEKIGDFFKHLDNLIILHQRKLEKTKALKSAYLSEMFPAEGEREPKRRFAGFTHAWEQRTVSDLADRYDNLRVPITASVRVAGSTPYYGANGIQDYVEGFTHDGEFILVAEDGANDLQNYPIQYVNGKVWVNNHAHVLQAKSEIADNKFLMNAMRHMNIEPYLVGGGRAKLNADVMMKISFRVPELAEQKQIGSFFANLDQMITLHQRKLEKLQNIKNAYLNEMFV